MVYTLHELSQHEASHIFTAFHRLHGFLNENNSDMCSHAHEKDFLCRHNENLNKNRVGLHTRDDMVRVIQENVSDIAKYEKFLKHLALEFQDATRNMQCPEIMLYCASILMSFHKRGECSEYLTLAVKLKLLSYECSCFYGDPTAIDTMMEFLDYISLYKCRHELFYYCIDVFFKADWCPGLDILQPGLSKVFEVAQGFGLNFFNPRNIEFKLMERKYAQHSLPEDLKRFLIFARHGYEDVCDMDTNAGYLHDLWFFDRNKNLFGLNDELIRDTWKKREGMYRTIQLLFLYQHALYFKSNYDKGMHEKVLHVLWETIRDPYITRKYFMSSLERTQDYPEYLEVWKWYSKIVLRDAKPDESSPRSLKHLARITIRRTLTECAQLPFGVQFLDIPQTLKFYLRLE